MKNMVQRLGKTGRATLVSRENKKGRTIVFAKGTPRYSKPSAHQKSIGERGKACASAMRGVRDVTQRRTALANCMKGKK